MSELKPCPFCGNLMDGYPSCTISFKRERRKVYGIYHEICTLKCGRCGCTLSQAGVDGENAENNVMRLWNRRANDERNN